MIRELSPYPSPRFRLPFDPVFDLSIVRATYALRHGREMSGADFTTLWMLDLAYEHRLMYEAALPSRTSCWRDIPLTEQQMQMQEDARSKRAEYQQKLGASPPTTWRNLTELNQIVTTLLAEGGPGSAADLLERGYPPENGILGDARPDRDLATSPRRAGSGASIWQKATSAPATSAMSRSVRPISPKGTSKPHVRLIRKALEAKPDLFEACYSLAVLEQDAGNATAATSWREGRRDRAE